MVKKFLYIFLIVSLIATFSNIVFATDILMDLNTSNNTTANTLGNTIDNTIYSNNQDDTSSSITSIDDYEYEDYEDAVSTTTADYENSDELSITNMINIILIVVGIVLILLGIAIIIKLK